MGRTGERGMAWFTLYLLNLLWAVGGTSTQAQSSCCEYGGFPKQVRGAGTPGMGRNLGHRGLLMRVAKSSTRYRSSEWVSQGASVRGSSFLL